MAIKQALAVKAMEAAADGKIVAASLSEVTNGWVALVINAAGKKLVCVTQGECPLSSMWAVESSCEQEGLHVDIMPLNANNAAVIRRFIKWLTPVQENLALKRRIFTRLLIRKSAALKTKRWTLQTREVSQK